MRSWIMNVEIYELTASHAEIIRDDSRQSPSPSKMVVEPVPYYFFILLLQIYRRNRLFILKFTLVKNIIIMIFFFLNKYLEVW